MVSGEVREGEEKSVRVRSESFDGEAFSKYGSDGFAGKFSSDLALTTRNEMQDMRVDALFGVLRRHGESVG